MPTTKILTIIGASTLLLSSFAYADTSNEMPKDEWLGKLKNVAPATICKSFTDSDEVNKQLVAAKIDYNKCLTLIPSLYDKCQTKFYSEIPATLNKENAEKWGGNIGECIGTDFAVNYFINNGTTPPPDTSTGKPSASADTNSTTATDGSTTDSQNKTEMSKDEWLGRLKAAAPELICKEFLKDEALSKQLSKLNIDYDKCLSLMPASIDKCATELSSSIPDVINKDSGEKWGNTLGECIGKDFAIKHLLSGSETPAS